MLVTAIAQEVVSPRRPVMFLPAVTHAREVFVGHIDLRQLDPAAHRLAARK